MTVRYLVDGRNVTKRDPATSGRGQLGLVLAVGDAVPAGIRGEYLCGRLSVLDERVHRERQIILRLHRIVRQLACEKLTKPSSSEGRKEGVNPQRLCDTGVPGANLTGGCIAVRIVADDAVRIAVNGGALDDMCEQTVFVCGAYAAGDRAGFGERVLD